MTDVNIQQLHGLINSLGKAEKRFFKMMASTEGDETDGLVNLFDLLEGNGKDLNKLALTYKIKEVDLNNLYTLVLRVLRRYNNENIEAFRIKDEIISIRCLFDKAQYKQCRKMLNILKRELFEHEEYNYLLKVSDIEKKLVAFEDIENKGNGPTLIANEEKSVINKELRLIKYYRLFLDINQKCTSALFKEDIKRLLEHPMLVDYIDALSLKEQLFVYLSKSAIYSRLNYQKEFEQVNNSINELVDNKAFLKEYIIKICKNSNEA